MKKIAFLGIMLFIISSQVFADENLDKLEDINFSCQLNDYQENNQKINFINLNLMFYEDYFLLNIYKNVSFNTNFQVNLNRQKHYQGDFSNQNRQTILQDDDLDLLGYILYNGAIITSWYMNNTRQDREIQNDMWKQQREAENIYRIISPNPTRNFYQGYP